MGYQITQSKFNEVVKQYVPDYERAMAASIPYQYKGMLHSEILMACALAIELGVEQVIESGRARGQSTELIARFLAGRNSPFHSIDCADNEDAVIAEERLQGLEVNIHYAESFEVFPLLINKKRTLAIVDGPKGQRMWRLGAYLLEHPYIKGVCFHDCYKKSAMRKIVDKQNPLLSDDADYVKRYKHLDDKCWINTGFKPYELGSYGGTLAFIGTDHNV